MSMEIKDIVQDVKDLQGFWKAREKPFGEWMDQLKLKDTLKKVGL